MPSKTTTETTPQKAEEDGPSSALQAPNRADVWARSQQSRLKAMTGPRFEQTTFDLQVGGTIEQRVGCVADYPAA